MMGMPRRRSVVLTIVGGFLIMALVPTVARASTVPAAVANAKRLDGTTVTLRGEAIGDILRGDDEHVWINILEETTALGVYLRRDDVADVRTLGDWRHVGDTLEVTGVFNAACDEHGGDMDIHAERVDVIVAGGKIARPIDWWKLLAGALGLLIGAVQVRIAMRRHRRRITTPRPGRKAPSTE